MNAKVSPSFWSDEQVEELSPELKLAALWLMTNSKRDLSGYTSCSARRFEFETGLDKTTLDKLCEALPKSFVRCGQGIWARNFIRHQWSDLINSAKNNIARSIVKQFHHTNEPLLKELIIKEYPSLRALFQQCETTIQSEIETTTPSEGLTKPKRREEKRIEEKSMERGPGKTMLESTWDRLKAIPKFKRTRPRTFEEEQLLADLDIPEPELTLIERWFAEAMQDEKTRLPESITSLLRHWTHNLDRARSYLGGSIPVPKKNNGAVPEGWWEWIEMQFPGVPRKAGYADYPEQIQRLFAARHRAEEVPA